MVQTRAKPFTESVRGALAAYRDSSARTLAQMARELGTNSTQVSKYLSGKPEGNVATLERTIEDVLKAVQRAAEREEAAKIPPFGTNVTAMVRGTCEMIRATNQIGLIHGPAGVGKSIGAQIYAEGNPSSILLTLTYWERNAYGVERQLFRSVESRGYKFNAPKAQWMVARLKDSNRIIMIDNAHRLTKGGLQWIFDFHDATQCPLLLVGNPEILDAIRKNDQQFSRIGPTRKATLTTAAKAADDLMAGMAPQIAKRIRPLAQQVAKNRGHLRALTKQILLALDFMRSKKFQDDPEAAFRAAHRTLVRDYELN